MKIGYVSDIHAEFRDYHPKLFNTDGGDLLIVAGDFCVASSLPDNKNDERARGMKKYIEKIRNDVFSKYKKVLMVLGNHEHYHGIFDKTAKHVRDYWAGSNVQLLDMDTYTDGDLVFVGATLWSDFEKGSPQSMAYCQRGISDFHVIYTKDPIYLTYAQSKVPYAGKYTPELALHEFTKSKKYIDLVAKQTKDKKVVVITHHGPTYKSLNRDHIGNGMDGAYCSDLSDLILDNHNICTWVHGHTHENRKYMVGDCQVLANQVGYRGHDNSWYDFKGIQHFDLKG